MLWQRQVLAGMDEPLPQQCRAVGAFIPEMHFDLACDIAEYADLVGKGRGRTKKRSGQAPEKQGEEGEGRSGELPRFSGKS